MIQINMKPLSRAIHLFISVILLALFTTFLQAGEGASNKDPSCFKKVRTIYIYDGEVHRLAFSPNEKTLAVFAGETDGLIQLFAIPSGKHLQDLQISTGLFSFSPNGKFLASWAIGEGIILWNLSTGKKLPTTFKCLNDCNISNVHYITFSPDGKLLASASADSEKEKAIRLWDVSSGKEIAAIKIDGLAAEILFSPDSKKIGATWSFDKGMGKWDYYAEIWDVTNLKQILRVPLTSRALFAPDLKSVVFLSERLCPICGEDTIELWKLSPKRLVRQLKWEQSQIMSQRISFSPNGKWLAAGSIYGNFKVWNLSTGQGAVFPPTKFRVASVSFSGTGKWMAAGGCAKYRDQECIEGAISLWSCQQ